jgi:hypothetical protein
MQETVCSACRQMAVPVTTHVVDEDGPLAGERLAALGIPPYDIVRVTTDSHETMYLLAADRLSASADDNPAFPTPPRGDA